VRQPWDPGLSRRIVWVKTRGDPSEVTALGIAWYLMDRIEGTSILREGKATSFRCRGRD